MRLIVAMLIVLAMAALASAISGIQSIHTDARLGTIVTYHHGLTRLYAVASAVVCIALVYAIYKRHIVAWWIGWIAFVLGPLQMIFMIARDTYSGPQMGLFSAVAASAAVVAVSVFWCYWWYRQRPYFT
jgi:hypothetical protein